MKQWLIKWSTSVHAGAAIVTGDTISQAQIAFMENTSMSDMEYSISSSNINSIEELKTRNPAKWLIYGLGEWGRDVDGLVFTNWETADFDPLTLSSSGLEHRAGADLGCVDPTTIVDTLYDRNNHKIYVFNEFYKRGQ